jgi:Fe-S-cluster containining protein
MASHNVSRVIPIQPSSAATGTALSCAYCKACCCRLEVMLMGEDDVPPELTASDPWGGQIMRRLDDGWCAALARDTMRCRIYERRPTVCREFELAGSDCIAERSAAGL